MIVTHRFPNGRTEILMNEVRFPNGPLSDSLTDRIEFLTWNIEQMRVAISRMPADKQRQDAIMERDRQVVMLKKMQRQEADKIRAARNEIIK